MPKKESELIGQLLVQRGLITIGQLEKALNEQEKSGRLIGSILIELGFIKEPDFYGILSEQLGVKYVKLNSIKITPQAIAAIPAKFATYYKLMPVDSDGESITIATSDPLDIHTLDDIRLLLHKKVDTVLASESDITEAINNYYGVGAETIERMSDRPAAVEERPEPSRSDEEIAGMSEDASIIKFVNQLFWEAYKDRATDIHIEPYGDELVIRYRIDGVLHDVSIPPNLKKFQLAIISRIKIMANLNIAEKRLPQDGRIKVVVSGEDLDMRVSVLPTSFGESVVIRLLSSNVFLGLESLGFLKQDLEVFERLIKAPHGIIFVTGPTGSGKTTTLYAALSRVNDKDKKIITIEDPVEYQMKNVVQIQVNPKIGLTFSQGLRSMLRHDPDIMMVGEVRDFETAEITIRIALTGHLVFSTLHTNDASGGITRLVDIGIEPFLVTSAVNAFMAQRLVRVVCDKCKEKIRVGKELLKELGAPESEIKQAAISIYKGRGCEACRNTGYKGRTAIYEILVVTDPIREMIINRASTEQIKKKAVSLGMRTLRQDGWEKIKMGITTPEEVLRVTHQEEANA